MPATHKIKMPLQQVSPLELEANYSDVHKTNGKRAEIKQNGATLGTNGTVIIAKEEDSDKYKSLPNREKHEEFLRKLCDILLQDAVFEGTNRQNLVVAWTEPNALKNEIDFSLPETGVSHSVLLNLTKQIIEKSAKTGHPRFINQLFSSVDPYGLAGQWITDALNPSVYTYEVTPVFTLMEEEVLKEMRKIVGFENGEGDGLFCPGGSMANGYAINLARHYFFPDIKRQGQQLHPLTLFTSEDAHYSMKKLAAFLGIGTDNVVAIKVDEKGKMDIDDLKKNIELVKKQGSLPFMVCATSGTTVMGAFDDLVAIGEICRKHNLWFHVDAAWGGGALLSSYSYLLNGIHLADSVTWNPHKLLAAPQQCSTLLLRHKDLLKEAHGLGATYLFQKDKFYGAGYDSGDKHMQCGRRADVLKFWFMWKAKGTNGLKKHVDRVIALSRYFRDIVKNREGFELIAEPQCTNVCFWYVPKSIRHLKGEEKNEALHRIAPIVKERMMKKGSMMITYQPLRGMPNFFRLVLQNSGVSEKDMEFFADEIERLAADL